MRPLEGIRIVEAAQMISAPLAASILSDQGADVIKVETANGVGDRMRSLGDLRNNLGSVFALCNRGKRSITLDTKQEAGVEAMRRLIDSADVFIQNFRPGAVDRMGIGPDRMRESNPRLVYVSVSGFGATGPYADQMVYDFVIQGLTGLAAHEGAGGDPVLAKNLVIDKATALTVAQAVSSALFARERTGVGQHLEINMLDAGLQFFWPDGMWSHTLLGEGITPTPPMSLNYAPRQTADGWVTLNLASNSTWPRIVAALDSLQVLGDHPGESVGADPRFQTYDDRQYHAADLSAAVDSILARVPTDRVMAAMRANDIPGGPVLSLDEVHLDPQVVHNRSLVEHDTAIGRLREPRPAARFDGVQSDPAGSVPRLGEHTDSVLAELGYDADAIAELRAAAVLGPVKRQG